MIYLFRKRNGAIIATTKQSADSTMNTPNNFNTYKPIYLGAISPLEFKAVGDKADQEVPMELEKIVKKDGEDTLITLTASQIADLIEGGDKKIEQEYEKLLKRKNERYNELLEELATSSGDRNSIPPSYNRKVAAVDDARGDLSGVLKGYVRE